LPALLAGYCPFAAANPRGFAVRIATVGAAKQAAPIWRDWRAAGSATMMLAKGHSIAAQAQMPPDLPST
jgi:hypothetical protein